MSESAPTPDAASSDLAAHHQAPIDPHDGLTLADEQAVVAALAEVNFGGELWREFAGAMAGYAFPRLTGMIMSGQIYKELASKGIHYDRRLPDTITHDDASEIAAETVARGLVGFRALLQRGGWVPTAGGRLTTFFFGQCLTRFSNEARRWVNHNEGGPTAEVSLDDDATVDDPGAPDPSDDLVELVAHREEVHRIMQLVDQPGVHPRMREILSYRAADFSDSQTAKALGTTKKAVQAALYRFRKLVQAVMAKGGSDGS
jgi:DNA-directed RNA polymerase specialized sigma24 family protein